MKRKIGLFEISVILFFYLLPAMSIIIDYARGVDFNVSASVIKWCVFWGVGLRLFTAGITQIFKPGFTANNIFNSSDEKIYPVVRELGFANACMGACAILSLFHEQLRPAAWMLGGLYYFLASLQHILRKEKNASEVFAAITDLTIVAELLLPLISMVMTA